MIEIALKPLYIKEKDIFYNKTMVKETIAF